MRRVVLLALAVSAVFAEAGCTRRQVDLTAATEAVRARSSGCAAAEAAKDVERALLFWAEDAILQARGTQQLQGRIVADLEELLKEARKRCGGSGQCSSPQSAEGGGSRPGGQPKQNPNPSPSKTPG